MKLLNILSEEVESQGNSCLDESSPDNEKTIVVGELKQLEDKSQYRLKAWAEFPVSVTTGGMVDKFISGLKDAISDVGIDKDKQMLNISVATIISSASNYLNGPVKPTMMNKLHIHKTPIPPQKFKDEPYYTGNEVKNNDLAKNRGVNLWNELKIKLPKLAGIGTNLSAKPTYSSHITDTGGCIDERRNTKDYPNPGQIVYVIFTFNVVPKPIVMSGEEEQQLECVEGLRILVGYFPKSSEVEGFSLKNTKDTHKCNYATFRIFLNDVHVGVVNMNNKEKGDSVNWAKKESRYGTKSGNGKEYHKPKYDGGQVYTILSVPEKKLKEVIKKSENGDMKLEMKGLSQSLLNGGKVHGDAPMVVVWTNQDGEKVVKYGPQEPFKADGFVDVNTRVPMGEFKACANEETADLGGRKSYKF